MGQDDLGGGDVRGPEVVECLAQERKDLLTSLTDGLRGDSLVRTGSFRSGPWEQGVRDCYGD